MRLPGNRLRLDSGKVVRFESARRRADYERIARAIKHGFVPTERRKAPKRP